MKKWFLIGIGAFTIQVSAQTLEKNFSASIVPKEEMTTDELDIIIGNTVPISNITINTPKSNEDFVASGSITLQPGAHIQGNSNLRIEKITLKDNSFLSSITYFDGLGRPEQEIAIAQSAEGKDFIRHFDYDQFGRSEKTYLPLPSSQNAGDFLQNPISHINKYYLDQYGDTNPYTQHRFDNTPLNRVLESSAPGNDWKLISNSDTDHTVKNEYTTNGLDEIYLFEINYFADNVSVSYYEPNELFKNITKSENWQPGDGQLNTRETFLDKDGKVVAEKTFRLENGLVKELTSYNIYDHNDRLRYSLSPKFSLEDLIVSSSGNVTITDYNTFSKKLNNLASQYQYDVHNRLIAKKVPGADWEYVVYDQLDRPIFVQDANLKERDAWLFTKFDQFGRSIYSGIYNSAKLREELQTEVDNFINASSNKANYEKRTSNLNTIAGSSINYSNNAFPISGIGEIFMINYFDDYNFIDPDKPTTPSLVMGQEVTSKVKNFPTANWTKTLGGNTWSKSYNFYDERGRSIKTYEKNYLGGYTWIESLLDFRGKVQESITEHKRINNSPKITIKDRFEYDHTERLVSQYQKINNQPEEHLVSNNYNELGFVVNKQNGGSSASQTLQSTNYTYNIRGWMTEINNIDNLQNNLFAYKINYNEPAEGQVATDQLYDGSITQTIWKSNFDNEKKSYIYKYDKLNQLTDGYYRFNDNLTGQASGRFELHNVKYDKNGNITSLQRNGDKGLMDNLVYNYGTESGNHLLSVTDAADKGKGFFDGNIVGDDYDYDLNGNLTKDLNKGINLITYNHLNLVEKVTFSNGKKIEFQYDASGRKLKKTFINGTNRTDVEYLGGFQYQQESLQFIPILGGYVYFDGTSNTYKYVYVISDHLGNNRVSYSDTNNDGMINDTELLSNSDYYPMGLLHQGDYSSGIASSYNYKFQGKELQLENGINLYDFGSRLYDPAVGRWFSVDPQNQFHSPYLAMGNNGVSLVDPDGEYALSAAAIGIIAATIVGGGVAAIKTASNGGDLGQSIGAFIKGATISGVSATVTSGIGSLVSPATSVAASSAGAGASNVPAITAAADIPASFGTGAASAGAGKLLGAIAGQAASQLLPSYDVNIGDFNFSISPAILLGNSTGVGANLGVGYSDGNFSISSGLGLTAYSNYNGQGSGIETRISGLVSYDDGQTGFSLGTNFFGGDLSGNKGVEDFFKQRTGSLGVRIGDLTIRYENDGSPFGIFGPLLVGKDSDTYRTAAFSVGYKDYSIGINLFTGDFDKDRKDRGIKPLEGHPDYKYRRKYILFGKKRRIEDEGGQYAGPNASNYRLGALYFNYKGFRVGTNTEATRHVFQNIVAHTWISYQPHFKVLPIPPQGYFQFQPDNPFTLW